MINMPSAITNPTIIKAKEVASFIAYLGEPELADDLLEKITGCRFATPESCNHEDCSWNKRELTLE